MFGIEISAEVMWLVFGVFCFALEAFGLTGVGLFFAGLGGLGVAIMVKLGLVGDTSWVAQFAWFFALTAAWAAALWRPIKEYRMRRRKSDYSNMVGERGTVVGAPLVKGRDGQVKWSGTMMVAELIADSTQAEIAVGEPVIIKEVKGNRLLVDKA